jgi:hypothetical protein
MVWTRVTLGGVWANTSFAYVWVNNRWIQLANPNQSMFEIAANAYYANRSVQIFMSGAIITGIAA